MNDVSADDTLFLKTWAEEAMTAFKEQLKEDLKAQQEEDTKSLITRLRLTAQLPDRLKRFTY